MGTIRNLEHNKIEKKLLSQILTEARKVIYGKDNELKLALAAILARGHLLIEDIPGMGKTTFVSCLALLLDLKMSRIQFTNDLLPADIIGSNIYDPKTTEFRFIKGPIFSEIILGDELNRASPRSQSAFLQAMEELSVSIDGKTYDLPRPFFIIATQNPMTQVGTHPLPESQLDRFLMKLSLGYPDKKSEIELLKGGNPRDKLSSLKPQLSKADLLKLQDDVDAIKVSQPIIEYVQNLLQHARSIGLPLSPRAGILLLQAARAWALLAEREFVIPEDIQDIAPSVLAHRIPRSEHSTIEQLISEVQVP